MGGLLVVVEWSDVIRPTLGLEYSDGSSAPSGDTCFSNVDVL